jgi:hypothetical protein
MSWLLFCIASLLGTLAFGAPLKTMSSLPFSHTDIAELKRTMSDEDIEEFIYFIKKVSVFPDHQNPKEFSGIENKNINKIYYIPPFFQPAEEREIIGGQEIFEQGIIIITEIYELLKAFDLDLYKYNELTDDKQNKEGMRDKIRDTIISSKNAEEISKLEILFRALNEDIKLLENQLTNIKNHADTALGETSQGLRRQLTNQVVLKLSFLGIIPTLKEQERLGSESSKDMLIVIASLIQRATSEVSFGFRNVTYEAGYTTAQRKWISLYTSMRPDVQVASLLTNTVYVRPTALSAEHDKVQTTNYFLGKAAILPANRLFVAINGASGGKCGNTRSCNVTLEYAYGGAFMAKAARFGALVMPIYFEGDAQFQQPDFKGSISCNIETGFEVEGRADVKDGAIIYDGDVNNSINATAIEEGICNIKIEEGDANSAVYYIIHHLYDYYMNLKMQRATKSRAEKDLYKKSIDDELKAHAVGSIKKKNFEVNEAMLWSTLGSGGGALATLAIQEARDFYWHTRFEKSSTRDRINFSVSLNERNIVKMERMVFDGFSLICWKKDQEGWYLGVCPRNQSAKYATNADTDMGKALEICDAGIDSYCHKKIKKNEKNINTDENGITSLSWDISRHR